MNHELRTTNYSTGHLTVGLRTAKGFSLIEAMMATVVLGIAAAGVLLPFTSGVTIRTEGVRRTLAAKLAGDLMENIVNTPFDQIAGSFGSYSEPVGHVKDASGAVFTGAEYVRFSRDASCVYVYVPQQDGTTAANFIFAVVRVYYDGREIVALSRLISK